VHRDPIANNMCQSILLQPKENVITDFFNVYASVSR
jgi:hypothetical protein